MEFKDIKIIKSTRPNINDLHSQTGETYIHVIFEYDNEKFNLFYEQAHYFYRGMPGTTRGYLKLDKLRGKGVAEVLYHQIDGQGEFQIPIPKIDKNGYVYVVKGYCENNEVSYKGDEMLNISDEEIFKYLIKPYFETYYL